MLSSADSRYLESNHIAALGDVVLQHLCAECPADPYTSVAELLLPLSASEGAFVHTGIPPPQRPLPAHQHDYLQQQRIPYLIEEWLFTLVQEKPANVAAFSYRYFLRNANSRLLNRPPEAAAEYFSEGIPAAVERFVRSKSPLTPRDRRSPHSALSTSPVNAADFLRAPDGGYLGDVSPRGGSSRAISPYSTNPEPSIGSSIERPGFAPEPLRPLAGDLRTPARSASPPHPPADLSDDASVSPLSTPSPHVRPVAATSVSPAPPVRVKILILFYSLHGHCQQLAMAAMEALYEMDTVEVEPHLYRFPEVLDDAALTKMKAVRYEDDDPRYVPELPSAQMLADFDGFLFVFPGRFGSRPAAVQSLMDSTGALWQAGRLVGKPAGVMVSTATQHGGHENAIRQFQRSLMHHGIVIIGVDPKDLQSQGATEIQGGSPYGASTIAGSDGTRTPSEFELIIARKHASRLAAVAAKLL